MTIDNFEQIQGLMSFDTEDEFYFVQILKRKKEHPELGSNSYLVNTYFISSLEQLERLKGEIILLASFHNARVYIHLTKRSFEQTAFQMIMKVVNQTMEKDFKFVKNAFNSVCETYAKGPKNWVVDIDEKGRLANDVLKTIDNCEPEGNKLIDVIQTKNGFHLITKPFNREQFSKVHPDVDIQTNNPTILYIP